MKTYNINLEKMGEANCIAQLPTIIAKQLIKDTKKELTLDNLGSINFGCFFNLNVEYGEQPLIVDIKEIILDSVFKKLLINAVEGTLKHEYSATHLVSYFYTGDKSYKENLANAKNMTTTFLKTINSSKTGGY